MLEFKFSNKLCKKKFMLSIREIFEGGRDYKYTDEEYIKFINCSNIFRLNNSHSHSQTQVIKYLLKESSFIYGYVFSDTKNKRMYIKTNIGNVLQISEYDGDWSKDSQIDFEKFVKETSKNVDIYVRDITS